MIEPSEFRRVMGHFPSGVTIVTSLKADGSPCGLTVNAFCSVSLDPPLVLVCVEEEAGSLMCMRRAGVYAVNVLAADAETLSRRFSTWDTEDKFSGIAYREESTGAPVLDDALAWADCEITDAIGAGDHMILIGQVLSADAREGRPLVYYRGGYGQFEP